VGSNHDNRNHKLKAGLVIALAATYLWQIAAAYIADKPIDVYLYVGLLVAAALATLIVREG
jgi:hypothetical protein